MVNLDVLVVGGGTSGERAASYALGDGRSVGMVEKGAVGGACIFNACIPTKALVHAARAYKQMQRADFFGLPVVTEGAEYRKVKAFKDRIVTDIGTGRDESWLKRGGQLFRGIARFKSAHEVVVDDTVIYARNIIISTGSLPAAPPIPGLSETGYITNLEAMELDTVPERLAIIGGGPVGVEFAQVFSAFGASVHIVEMMPRLLSLEDEDISFALEESLRSNGVLISTSVKVNGVRSVSSGKVLTLQREDGGEEELECDEIMVATGRKPNMEELNLPATGVETTKRGITVDASMQTSVPHIWAIGDVTGTYFFTYVAGDQARAAALNATSESRKEMDYSVLPRSTFCDPEIASVGLTENQAREQGYRVKAGTFNYADLTRPIVMGDTEGFVKIVAEEGSGRILGGHIIGSEASTLIHEIAVAVAAGASVSRVGDVLHTYPTFSEGIRYACQSLE